MTCNLCGSDNSSIVIQGRFGLIVKCKQCGLMARQTSIASHPVEHAGGVERLARQFEAKQENQLVDYEKCFPILENNLTTQSRKLLEIGPYTGHFLNLARSKHWQVKGVEPDPNPAKQAIQNFGLDITISDLRNANLPDESLDVIVMFHVIEHFRDPMIELKEINRILRKDGILVVETPRFDTIWFKLLKERERSVIPDHFFFFTRKTLTQMVTKSGFSVIQLDTVGRTLTLDRLFTNISKVIGSGAISKLIVKVEDAFHFQKIRFHVNTHDMMRVYAKKKPVTTAIIR